MDYKVVPFDQTDNVSSSLQNIINSQTENGYEYVSHEYSDKIRPGTNGCFGIGARPDSTTHIGFVVFKNKN